MKLTIDLEINVNMVLSVIHQIGGHSLDHRASQTDSLLIPDFYPVKLRLLDVYTFNDHLWQDNHPCLEFGLRSVSSDISF